MADAMQERPRPQNEAIQEQETSTSPPALMAHVDDPHLENILYSLRETEDAVEDMSMASLEAGDEHAPPGHTGSGPEGRTGTVVRPFPSLSQLIISYLGRSGLVQALQINTNREAGPVDLALLRASRRPPWRLFAQQDCSLPKKGKSTPLLVAIAQGHALLLRRGPDYARENQVLLQLPPEEPLFQPGNWSLAFTPQLGRGEPDWVAVAGWSGVVHIFPCQPPVGIPGSKGLAPCVLPPALSIPPPPLATPTQLPAEHGLVAGMAWRSETRLMILRYTGLLQCFNLRALPRAGPEDRAPGSPEGESSPSHAGLLRTSTTSMDLGKWHRGICSAMTYDPFSRLLVVAGGSLRHGSASLVTVWRATSAPAGAPCVLEHEVAVPVGPPFHLKPSEGQHASTGFLHWWLGGAGLASALDRKVPVECPVLQVSLAPRGGGLLAVLDLEGGLSLFAFRGGRKARTGRGTSAVDGAWGSLGRRMVSLRLEGGGDGKSVQVSEVAWWSKSALTVLDKKGHVHVLLVELEERDGQEAPRFRPLLTTAHPVGRGGALVSFQDDWRFIVLQCFVGLQGRLRGKLVRAERQTPEESMMELGRAGRLQEALEVAEQYGLETNPVFKAAWREKRGKGGQGEGRGGLSVQDVHEILARVEDTAWVMEQVLAEGEVEEGADWNTLDAACRLGLDRSEHARAPADTSLCSLRLKVLDLRDRLATFRALLLGEDTSTQATGHPRGGQEPAASQLVPKTARCKPVSATASAGQAASWATFYRRPLREVGEEWASEGNVTGLLQLTRQHPLALAPSDLADLLSLLPESLPPSSYQQLLPGLAKSENSSASTGGPSPRSSPMPYLDLVDRRPLDWVEEGQIPQGWRGYWTPESLDAWYSARAEQVEANGGALGGNVMELINIGLARGCPEGGSTSRLRAEVWHFTRVVYAGLDTGESQEGEGVEEGLTLQAWRKLPLRTVMRRILEHAPLACMEDTSSLVQLIEVYIWPMLRGPLAQVPSCQKEQQPVLALQEPHMTGVPGDGEAALAEEVTDFLVTRILEARKERLAREADVYADQYEADEETVEAWHAAEVRAEVVLRAAVAVAQASKPNLSPERRVLQREADLFRFVLQCSRAHDDCLDPPGAIDLLWSLIECLPVASAAAAPELQAEVDALEARLTVVQYLSNYSIAFPLSVYERFQMDLAGGSFSGLEGSEADFRVLGTWEDVLPVAFRKGPAAVLDDRTPGKGSQVCADIRLDIQILARMARYLAVKLQEMDEQQRQQQEQEKFWNEVGEDVRALQAGGIFYTLPLYSWTQALVYAALKGVAKCGMVSSSPPRRALPPPPPPSTTVLASAMAGLQLPAAGLEPVVFQLLQDWLHEADGGLDHSVNRARALLAAVPFSSRRCHKEAQWLEAVVLATKLAGDKGWGKEDLTPTEVRAAAQGGYGMQILLAILDTRPKLVLTEDGERDLLRLAGLLGMEEEEVEPVLKFVTIKKAMALEEYEMAALALLESMPVPKLVGAVVELDEGRDETWAMDEEDVWSLVFALLTTRNIETKIPSDLLRSIMHRALIAAPPHHLLDLVEVITESVLACKSFLLPSSGEPSNEEKLQVMGLEDYKHSFSFVRNVKSKEHSISPLHSQEWDDVLLELVKSSLEKAREVMWVPSKTYARNDNMECSPLSKANTSISFPPAVQEFVERALIYLLSLHDGRRGVAWVRKAVSEAEKKAHEEAAEAGRRAQIEGEIRFAHEGAKKGGTVVDEGSIVKQLLARGYSKFGALRAARAVGNKSADAAIQWAVAHSHDPGFDDPLPAETSRRQSLIFHSSSPPPLPALAGLGNFAFPRPSSPWRDSEEVPEKEEKARKIEESMLEAIRSLAIRYLCLEALVERNGTVSTPFYCASAEELLKHAMALPEPPPPPKPGASSKGENEESLHSEAEVLGESLAQLCRRELAAYSQEAERTGVLTTLQAFVPWTLDGVKVRIDQEYRREAVFAAARQDDAQAWKAAMMAAEAWGVEKGEVALAHLEFWFQGPLKEAWSKFRAAGLGEVISRFEKVALGKRGSNGSEKQGSGTRAGAEIEQDLSALGSQWDPRSAGAQLIASTPEARHAVSRLAVVWDALDGQAMSLLELLSRIMAEITTVAEKEAGEHGESFVGIGKRLRDHVQLLRRLVRIPNLPSTLNYKRLTASTPPYLTACVLLKRKDSDSEDTAQKASLAPAPTRDWLIQESYRELVHNVRRDNVTALSKLAARILLPCGPLSASTVNRAYAEALLRGLDPLLSDEEANLPLARASAEERFSHRAFVAEPYLDRLASSDLIGLLESVCMPRLEASRLAEREMRATPNEKASPLLSAGPCLSSVSDRSLVSQKIAILYQSSKGKGGDTHVKSDDFECIQRIIALLEALTLSGGDASEDSRALETAWIEGTDVSPVLESMLVEGRGGGWAGLQTLMRALKRAAASPPTSSPSFRGAKGFLLPQDEALGVLVGAVKHLLGAPLPFDKAHLVNLERILTDSVAASRTHDMSLDNEEEDAGAQARWALIRPILEEFVAQDGAEEEGEGGQDGSTARALSPVQQGHQDRARADVVEIVLRLGTGFSLEGGNEAMVLYHRAAEMMWEGLGRKLSRREAETVDGRVQALLAAMEGPKGLEKAGAETALALVRLWSGSVAKGSGPLGLAVDWSRWVLETREDGDADKTLPGEEAACDCETTLPEYDVIYRRLTERALDAHKWNGASSLLLWSPWRYRGGDGGDREEEELAAKLGDLQAPLALRLKVALSSPHAALRAEAVAGLPALLGDKATNSEEEATGGVPPVSGSVHATPRPCLSSRVLVADETLLALIVCALFPPRPVKDPLTFLFSSAWRVVADALLFLPHSPKASRVPPLPASVAFVAARLVIGRAHLHAGALVADAQKLHPALRTVEGVLSLLWTTLCSGTYHIRGETGGTLSDKGHERDQLRQSDIKLWSQVREAAKKVLEQDETDT